MPTFMEQSFRPVPRRSDQMTTTDRGGAGRGNAPLPSSPSPVTAPPPVGGRGAGEDLVLVALVEHQAVLDLVQDVHRLVDAVRPRLVGQLQRLALGHRPV